MILELSPQAWAASAFTLQAISPALPPTEVPRCGPLRQPFQLHLHFPLPREMHLSMEACESEEVLPKPLKESKFRFKTCTTLASHAAQSPHTSVVRRDMSLSNTKHCIKAKEGRLSITAKHTDSCPYPLLTSDRRDQRLIKSFSKWDNELKKQYLQGFF